MDDARVQTQTGRDPFTLRTARQGCIDRRYQPVLLSPGRNGCVLACGLQLVVLAQSIDGDSGSERQVE